MRDVAALAEVPAKSQAAASPLTMKRQSVLYLLAVVLLAVFCPQLSAQTPTYNWSFGYPGYPGCVAVPFPANWANCSTAAQACTAIAGVELGSSPYYVSTGIQAQNGGGFFETVIQKAKTLRKSNIA